MRAWLWRPRVRVTVQALVLLGAFAVLGLLTTVAMAVGR